MPFSVISSLCELACFLSAASWGVHHQGLGLHHGVSIIRDLTSIMGCPSSGAWPPSWGVHHQGLGLHHEVSIIRGLASIMGCPSSVAWPPSSAFTVPGGQSSVGWALTLLAGGKHVRACPMVIQGSPWPSRSHLMRHNKL